ncbi:carboxypeptidase-like regulatory domain-containing protein [Halovivax sp.]|uniref:carboxypeptidase-like regulatory domain-containing protein n=1 Tax=Halovivax sp. TaxID=1935978 RepID=UPI0025C3E8D2|nr:carboxypeptidase-like regulatory domain-containing protein [Halovivax sp.]
MSADHEENALLAVLASVLESLEVPDTHISFATSASTLVLEDLEFAETSPADGDEARDSLRAAARFARATNEVPTFEAAWDGSGALLWNQYRPLFDAQWAIGDGIDAATAERLEEARERRRTTYEAFETYLDDAYEELAAREDPPEQLDDRATALAERAWTDSGKADEYDQATAIIDELTANEAVELRTRAEERFRAAQRFAPEYGEFFYTAPRRRASDVAENDDIWWQLQLDREELEEIGARLPRDHPRLVGSEWALDRSWAIADVEAVSLELARVGIHRGWFARDALTSQLWRWRNPSRAPFSDGEDPPSGTMPGYVDELVFARNLRVVPRPRAVTRLRSASDLGDPETLGPFRTDRADADGDGGTLRSLLSVDRERIVERGIEFVGSVLEEVEAERSERSAARDSSDGDEQSSDDEDARYRTVSDEQRLDESRNHQQRRAGSRRGGRTVRDRRSGSRRRGSDRTRERRSRGRSGGSARVRDHRTDDDRDRTQVPADRGRDATDDGGRDDEEPGVCEGTVLGADGVGLDQVTVTFTADETVVTSAVTDEDGAFEVELPAQRYGVRATRPGYRDRDVGAVDLEPGANHLEFALEPDLDGAEITVLDGTTLVAYVCEPLPAVPDPDPYLEWSEVDR